MAYIGVDVGTSGCKASVLETSGKIRATAFCEYAFLHKASGWVELDIAELWASVKTVLKELAPKARDVKAIAFSSIGESMVLCDEDDNILHNAIVYLDTRAESTVPYITAHKPAEEIHRITGMPMNQMYSLNKLLWFRRHMLDLYDKIRKVYMFVEYFSYKLSGVRACDPSSAARTMLMDARKLDWSPEMMDTYRIDRGWFAPIRQPGEPLGPILPALAEELGLPKEMQVLMGCHDQPCATLGSGTMQPGEVLLGEGSSESINLVLDSAGLTESLIQHRIGFEPFFNGKYFITAAQLTHGTSIRWFVKMFREKLEPLLAGGEGSIYTMADTLCAEDSGSVYFLPYMSGVDPNDADNDARGCFVGMDISVTVWQLYRALLEGLCFETRMRLERLGGSGVEIGRIIAAGGAAKSHLFMQMKADVLRHPVHILSSAESGIKGLGMICAVACGDYKDYEQAAARFAKITASYTPARDYADRYKEYKMLHRHVRAMYRDLR